MDDKFTIKINESLFVAPKPKSVALIGANPYKTIIPAGQHFNWFQKLMWKLCFGVKIEDYSEE